MAPPFSSGFDLEMATDVEAHVKAEEMSIFPPRTCVVQASNWSVYEPSNANLGGSLPMRAVDNPVIFGEKVPSYLNSKTLGGLLVAGSPY